MLTSPIDRGQIMQRLRVGITGLLAVLLLVVVAATVYQSASRELPSTAIGAPKPDVVANMTGEAPANVVVDKSVDDPLAEIGAAPSTKTPDSGAPDNSETPAAAQ